MTGISGTRAIAVFLAAVNIACLSLPAWAGVSKEDPETAACTHSNIGAIEISLPNILLRRSAGELKPFRPPAAPQTPRRSGSRDGGG